MDTKKFNECLENVRDKMYAIEQSAQPNIEIQAIAKDVVDRTLLAVRDEFELKDKIKTLTSKAEFYLTGAYAQGVEINGHKILVVTQIEDDTFCGGEQCNKRIEEYGL